MKFRWSSLLIIAISSALMGMAAHGSYVVEADGTNLGTGAIATGADFDFVAHDFGIEAAEAIQITLANLNRATNVRGNLLLWSFSAAGDTSSDDTAQDEMSSAEPSDTTEGVAVGNTRSSEDYSYYDEGIAGAGQNANAASVAAVGGGEDGVPLSAKETSKETSGESPGESLVVNVEDLPAIDTNAIFWILKPTEFTSFSQMTAARFGFTVGHDQNSN